MSRFNIRVYGIWIQDGHLLVNEEIIRGRQVIKLPGGGMEIGEGTIDCLKREWQEELGLHIDVTDHFYTTDFYQPSAFDDSQVISIYYRVSADSRSFITNYQENERTYWLPVTNIKEDTFTLPIDRIVGNMIMQGQY
ncbi:MAG: hypothetical protein BGO70_02835 [Bacteroidetes bacterium 43-93]|nr:NUDIX hydrolase [Bacteroidota bacterium]OJW95794.1 MAG: hypothetical protein BGO70_02835 [Bacteroidetes bacterium 43-93]